MHHLNRYQLQHSYYYQQTDATQIQDTQHQQIPMRKTGCSKWRIWTALVFPCTLFPSSIFSFRQSKNGNRKGNYQKLALQRNADFIARLQWRVTTWCSPLLYALDPWRFCVSYTEHYQPIHMKLPEPNREKASGNEFYEWGRIWKRKVVWKQIPIIPDLKKAVSLYKDFIHKTTYELHKYKWCTAEDGALHLFFYGRKSAMPEKSNSVPLQQGRLPSSPVHLMPMKQAITQNVCAWQSSH